MALAKILAQPNVLAISLLASSPAFASDAASGSVSGPTNTNSNILYFIQSGSRTALPSCATDPRWVVDTSTTAGQNLYANLIVAYSLGKNVVIHGTGTCLSGTANEIVGYMGPG